MKKNFKFYSFGWILLLALFNLIAFIIPALPDVEKYTPSFWIGYSFVTVAFLGQFICSWFVFKEDNTKKTFYNISLLATSYTGLISTFVVGLICMITPAIPYWVAAIACSVVLVINIFVFAKAKLSIDIVRSVDDNVEKATSFIYDMRKESDELFARAKDDTVKALCKKVRDAFKFSDPMSKTSLSDIETEIKTHYDIFEEAVCNTNAEMATDEAEEVLSLISERNSKCKRLK